MDNTFAAILKQIAIHHSDHLQERFNEMPAGSMLCVHDRITSNANDDWKATYEVVSHILTKEMSRVIILCVSSEAHVSTDLRESNGELFREGH